MLRNNLLNTPLGFVLKFLALSLYLLAFTCPAFASKEDLSLIDGLENPYPAPLLMGITSWMNSKPIKLSELSNKVILVEFWTSSCPYCRNALPHVNSWYKRYHNRGFLVIGIHSPKNEEEKGQVIVKEAIDRYAIHYPVALDNNFETWDNYRVEGWPSFYLIDRSGNVVYATRGAQDYEIMENNIRFLLNLDEDGSKPMSEAKRD